MGVHKKQSDDNQEMIKAIADFLVEDYRFCRSFVSAVNKLFNEESKKYGSTYLFHKNKINELADKLQLQIKIFDGFPYDEGLPITPLNADEFTSTDNLFVKQTIEPAIITSKGNIVHQGTVILAEKNN